MRHRRATLGTFISAVVVMSGITALTTGDGAAAQGPTASAAPVPEFATISSGEQAIARLGDDLDEVAEQVDLSATELATELREDPELKVDRLGELMYVDKGMLAPGTAGSDPPIAPGAFPYADTFSLHSNPGSKRVIFLDFDGHVVSGTGWNTNYNSGNAFTASPYDIDGNPNSFNDAERDVIQYVWQSIAEDYSTFDVDVTTAAPSEDAITRSSPTDDEYGTRLVISDTDTIGATCNCGGIAYLGVFDRTSSHGAFQPAFVFTRSSKNAKFIAEAGAHEIGHNLGLSHDGVKGGGDYFSGQGNWAPIMGVGYSKAVVQWSKGEYRNATNKQDDLAVIASHGLSSRVDEAGAKTTVAEYLGQDLPVTRTGFITDRTDVDLYRFNAGAGELTVEVTADQISPDLDVSLQLLNAKGTKLVAAGAPGEMGASITKTVTEGTYYVRIDGVADGSAATTGYSDYASIGRYTLSISGTDPTGSVANVKPTAKITASTKSVGIPGPITLTNAGSWDSDGEVASTTWSFGDGSTNGTGYEVTHTYSTAGSYTITMTVTDDDGLSATSTLAVKALPAVTVSELAVGTTLKSNRTYAAVTAKVVDAEGNPVLGAKVTVKWTGTTKGSGSGTTRSDGTVVITGPIAKPGSSLTATVSAVSASSKIYNPNLDSSVVVVSRNF